MKFHIAICDDDNEVLKDIKARLLQYKKDYEKDLFNSGRQLLQSDKIYDLIFLDIEMPEIDGMQVASELRERKYDGHIVFLTSHTEFMPNAFKVRAFRFLNKPIADADFEETLKESEKEIVNNKKIVVHTTEGTRILNLKDIIFIESSRNYTNICVRNDNGSGIIVRKSLGEWMNVLGNEHFYQVHKSYIIALRYIDAIDNSQISLKHTELRIAVSKRKVVEVKEVFLTYVRKYALCV